MAQAMSATGLGYWDRSGVMYVQANAATIGPTEAYPVIAKTYKWIAGDITTGEWPDERRIAHQHGCAFLPWRRCRTLTDLDTVVQAKKRWKAPAAILNVESPDTRDVTFMRAVLKTLSTLGTAMVVGDGWWDPSGRWEGFSRWVGSPECFPEANPAFADVAGCLWHADQFMRNVLPCLGAYGTSWRGRLPVRRDYAYPPSQPIIVYPGDSVEDWKLWPGR